MKRDETLENYLAREIQRLGGLRSATKQEQPTNGEQDSESAWANILDTFKSGKDFEDRFAIVETKLPAIDMMRKAAQNKIGRFTKQEIRKLCPFLSISSIEGSLRKLVKSGELAREGVGKATCYIQLK